MDFTYLRFVSGPIILVIFGVGAAGAIFSSPFLAFISRALFSIWILVIPTTRLISPDATVYWIRGFNSWGIRLLIGDGAWSDLTPNGRAWIDIIAFVSLIIGVALFAVNLVASVGK